MISPGLWTASLHTSRNFHTFNVIKKLTLSCGKVAVSKGRNKAHACILLMYVWNNLYVPWEGIYHAHLRETLNDSYGELPKEYTRLVRASSVTFVTVRPCLTSCSARKSTLQTSLLHVPSQSYWIYTLWNHMSPNWSNILLPSQNSRKHFPISVSCTHS